MEGLLELLEPLISGDNGEEEAYTFGEEMR